MLEDCAMPGRAFRATILLVEDEAILRNLLSETLNEEGFYVETAETADAAWRSIDEGLDFHMLLTDVRMPGELDGLDLATRAKERSPQLPIIVMSGYVGEKNMHKDLGTFIAKPFTRERMMQVVGSLWN